MSLLNISLCLPELDIIALTHIPSIVAVTERFIVPDKSFVLLPCRELESEECYRACVRQQLEAFTPVETDRASATHWAQCVLCQQITDKESLEEIAPRTIWTNSYLLRHLKSRKKLFLSVLRVYELTEEITIETAPASDQLYRFLPLPNVVDGEVQSPVLNEEAFASAKQAFLKPAEPSDPEPEDILNSAKWVAKIADTGNSSEGHLFEKLVRKGLLTLGFQNTDNRAAASLDPNTTGGAGGIDFYANQPYRIVGECKASKHRKINTDAATQVVRLGLQNLEEEHYIECIKIVISGGALTAGAEDIARGHRVNVIRPETMQRLVESKVDFPEDFDLYLLKHCLENEPFGESADLKINEHLNCWQGEWREQQEHQQLRLQSIQSLEELSQQPIASPFLNFSVQEVRAHHNAKHRPIITDARMERILEDLYTNSKIGRRRFPNGDTGYYPKTHESAAN